MSKNIACIIQARMNSSRFPAKIMAPINNKNLLTCVIDRVKLSNIKNIIVATTNNPCDDIIENLVYNKSNIFGIYRGDENDVLKRYIDTMKHCKFDVAIRVTADCPLIDPININELLEEYANYPNSDYIWFENMPEGIWSAELVSLKALELIYNNTNEPYYREHVTPYIRDNPKMFHNVRYPLRNKHYSRYKTKNTQFSVDTVYDLEWVREIFEYFSPRINFKVDEIIEFYKQYKQK